MWCECMTIGERPLGRLRRLAITAGIRSMNRPRFAAPVLAAALLGGLLITANPPAVDAASCIRISGGVFNSPGNDNYMPNLNGEYVRIHNYCSTAKYLTGW